MKELRPEKFTAKIKETFDEFKGSEEKIIFINESTQEKIVFGTNDLSVIFKNENLISKIKKEHSVVFKTSQVALYITGEEFLSFQDRKKFRRVFILTDRKKENLNEESEKEPILEETSSGVKSEIIEENSKGEKQYTVACGILTNSGRMEQIEAFKGPKNKIINFLNDQMVKKELENPSQTKILINLNFSENTKQKLSNWNTLEELFEKKIIS